MPTQMNHEKGGGSYKTAKIASTPAHKPQSNFSTSGSGTGPKGGTNRSKGQMNFSGKQGVPGVKSHGSHFGEKAGTGCNNGF